MKNKYLVLLAFFAFAIYSAYNFLYLSSSPIFPDEGRYISEAVTLVEKGEFLVRNDRAWEMPLVAIIYSSFYKVFDSQESLILSIRFFQSILLILNAFLIYKISYLIFKNRKISIIAYIITLFYPYFIYYQALLLSETIFITFLLFSFYFLYRWKENSFKIDINFALANLFFILTIYTRATLTILPPLIFLLFIFLNKFDLKSSLKIFIYSICIYMSLLSPWWIRNYNIFNEFVPFTTSSSSNLYLGNNSKNLIGGCDWSKDIDFETVNKIKTIKDEIDRSKVYSNEAKEFISKNPDRFFELMWLKFQRFWSVVPNTEAFSSGIYKWISILSFGIILPLALISFFINLKNFFTILPIYILIAYITLLHSIVIASLRYRLPIEPFLIILASFVIGTIWSKFSDDKNS